MSIPFNHKYLYKFLEVECYVSKLFLDYFIDFSKKFAQKGTCMFLYVVLLSGGDLDNGFRSWRDLERVLEGVSRESRDVSQEYWIFGNRCTMKYIKDCLRNSSSKRGYGFVQNTLSIVNLTLDNIVQNSWKKFYSVLKLKQLRYLPCLSLNIINRSSRCQVTSCN